MSIARCGSIAQPSLALAPAHGLGLGLGQKR
jgi:hypothetical protein